MTWWKGIANSIAHGEPPLGIAHVVVWRCELCGGVHFRVLGWQSREGEAHPERVKNTDFALRCLNCGTVEVNSVKSVTLW